MFNYFSTALCYYVVTLSLSYYLADPITNGFVMGTFELFGVFFAMLLIWKFGRKSCYIFTLVLPMVAAIFAIIFHSLYENGCESCSYVETVSLGLMKFSFSANFCIVCVYMSELFPTVVRALAFGACSTMGRVSSSFTPLLLSVSNNAGVNPLIITVLSLAISSLLSFFLPETKGKPMKDYLQEDSNNTSLEMKDAAREFKPY